MLSVPGEPEFLARRVTEWLRREARRDLERAVARHAKALGRKPGGLRVGDPKSRWGSCSSKGVLTFSWRLVLAPPRVLDYLAAHEVAHLKEMNHGRKFWALVERLDPDYEAARAWLNKSPAWRSRRSGASGLAHVGIAHACHADWVTTARPDGLAEP